MASDLEGYERVVRQRLAALRKEISHRNAWQRGDSVFSPMALNVELDQDIGIAVDAGRITWQDGVLIHLVRRFPPSQVPPSESGESVTVNANETPNDGQDTSG